MKPCQVSSWSRIRRRRVLLASVAVLVCSTGCGHSPGASPSAAAPSAGASRAQAACVQLDTKHVEAFSRSMRRLPLPHRDYRFPGSVRVADFTDHTAALLEQTGEHQRVWLLDLTGGKRRLALTRTTLRRPGWWIASVRLSDSWLAWEEVGPGDDLRGPVAWRLCAAPIRRPALAVGPPMAVADAATTHAGRPLFDLAGRRLAWVSTAWSRTGAVRSAQLSVRDLPLGEQQVLYESQGSLDTVSCSGAHLVVGETPVQGDPRARFVVLDARSGQPVAEYDVGNDHALSHWPAWRDGRLAWTPFPSQEATYPLLYLRDASGHTSTDGGFAVDPCFVGGYLFYEAWRVGSADGSPRAEVRALRFDDMTSYLLEAGNPEDNLWWHGAFAAPDVTHTYVAYLDQAPRAEAEEDAFTTVRVYDTQETRRSVDPGAGR